MSEHSKIEWTDATWNPLRGCTKISPGCKHCYAETFAERFRGVKGHPYEQGFDLRLVPEKLAEPFLWSSPRTVFVNSMSDYSLRQAIQVVNGRRSAVMKAEFFPILKANSKNSWSNIEDLLVAYRYFKEVRNSLIHSGGFADVRVVDARNDLAAIPFSNLGLKEALQFPPLAVGDRVNVGLRNVVGLSSIIHRSTDDDRRDLLPQQILLPAI